MKRKISKVTRYKIQKRLATRHLVEQADDILRKALVSNSGKWRCALAAEKIVDAQSMLLDAITWLETR